MNTPSNSWDEARLEALTEQVVRAASHDPAEANAARLAVIAALEDQELLDAVVCTQLPDDLAELYSAIRQAERSWLLSVAIDGEVVMRSAAEPARVLPGAENDNSDDLSLTSMWDDLDADYPPQLLAELIHHDVLAAMTIGMVPEEFKCSRFGKRVMKAAKYATYGVATAVTAACCTSVSPACLACAFSAGAAGGAIGDAFDDYCG